MDYENAEQQQEGQSKKKQTDYPEYVLLIC